MMEVILFWYKLVFNETLEQWLFDFYPIFRIFCFVDIFVCFYSDYKSMMTALSLFLTFYQLCIFVLFTQRWQLNEI